MVLVPCAIALGSNLGNSRQILQQALVDLHCPPEINVLAESSLYQTVAIGPPQPDILNACALLTTTLSPLALLSQLLDIEQRFGRVRQEHWGPRTLDLDLLFYGQAIITEPNLHVPHPRLRERAFVLIPLAEIAANWRDPVSGQLVQILCKAVDPTGVKLLGPIHG
ncbi:2-amino-4-hydroxy-6-hydroxymethyldihydropteridine diphosphokinase [Nodosilinea sp. E11]|uniref:2-amino-4-hydroxy-6- hydroxymethyldihydropteridine diphosphokinase n=1 Tax=Nodosilinea sp. E11 TaxID=3037479 RepID=UPI00293473E8|nr:2-amino-4-hydroxy-6-hydroxymethyldihydropteridine diphosphokinase [Nodosilinea sp. E11]WOD38757.1 2-amino-4-hydroxy-6-hydroxymethyldihydropteridine diphosphokinase [Nodosilinea sp. E11]